MANNKSILILRGSRNNILKNKDMKLEPGQPLFNSTDNYLTVGSGTDDDLNSLTNINGCPIVVREIKGYVDENSSDPTNSSASELKYSITYEKGSGLKFNNAAYYEDIKRYPDATLGLIPSATMSGFQSIAFGGLKFNELSEESSETATSAEGYQSFAFGGSTHAYGDWSIAGGLRSKAYQGGSVVFGGKNQAGKSEEEFNSYFWDDETQSSLNGGKNEDGVIQDNLGRPYLTSMSFAFCGGEQSSAKGRTSFSYGLSCHADGNQAISLQYQNKANGNYSSAFGAYNVVNGTGSTSFGAFNKIDGVYAGAIGLYNNVIHSCSAAVGECLKSPTPNSLVIGRYNSVIGTPIFSIGNGASDNNRHNLFSITSSYIYFKDDIVLTASGVTEKIQKYSVPLLDGASYCYANDAYSKPAKCAMDTFWLNGVGGDLAVPLGVVTRDAKAQIYLRDIKNGNAPLIPTNEAHAVNKYYTDLQIKNAHDDSNYYALSLTRESNDYSVKVCHIYVYIPYNTTPIFTNLAAPNALLHITLPFYGSGYISDPTSILNLITKKGSFISNVGLMDCYPVDAAAPYTTTKCLSFYIAINNKGFYSTLGGVGGNRGYLSLIWLNEIGTNQSGTRYKFNPASDQIQFDIENILELDDTNITRVFSDFQSADWSGDEERYNSLSCKTKIVCNTSLDMDYSILSNLING